MAISSIGNGLTIAINCDFVSHHEWMGFLQYVSILKHLPEAKVIITCRRRMIGMNIFNWCRRCNVHLLFHTSENISELHNFLKRNKALKTECVLITEPNLVFLHDFEEVGFDKEIISKIKHISETDGLVSEIKSENSTVCCDYSSGWGKFVTANWINKNSIPFSTINFACAGMSVNENRLAKVWNAARKLYPNLARG